MLTSKVKSLPKVVIENLAPPAARAAASEFQLAIIQKSSMLLNEEEFKTIRLLNGVYLQLHSYMLRVAIPNGVLNAEQLLMLALISCKYDRGYFHVTTRQNVQFN